MGAANDMLPSEVRAEQNRLECSPSQHDDSGHFGGKKSIAVGGEAVTKNTRGDHTSELQMTDRTRKLPNYVAQFARKAPQF
jgi:hypothetical protein